MFVLWTWTWNKNGKKPSIWGNLYKSLKKNNFLAVCKFKKKNVERAEENQTNIKVFSVKNKNKNVEKIEQKKKDIILKVSTNQQIWFGYANGYRKWGNAYTKKFLGTHWKANFTKKQVTTPPIWWVGHKNFRVLWLTGTFFLLRIVSIEFAALCYRIYTPIF